MTLSEIIERRDELASALGGDVSGVAIKHVDALKDAGIPIPTACEIVSETLRHTAKLVDDIALRAREASDA